MLKGFHFVALGIVAVVIYAMFKAECRLIADYFINPHFKEASTIVLTQYGVSIEGTRAQFLPWDHFREYKHNTHMLVMLMGKRASLIVPFALIPPEDKARLITFVDEKLSGFPSLISAEGAYFALQAGEAVKFIDASWYMPQEKRKAKEEYAQEHLPGAVFFDIDEKFETKVWISSYHTF